MLVSGGQILAIDKVYTDQTLTGDGVKQLGVNTEIIATTELVSGTSAILHDEISAVSAKMHETEVSGDNVTIVVNRKVKEDGKTVVYEVSATPQAAIVLHGINGISAASASDGWTISYTGQQGNIYSAHADGRDHMRIYQEDGQWYLSAYVSDTSKFVTSANDTLAGKALVLKDNEWVPADEAHGDIVTINTFNEYNEYVNSSFISNSAFSSYSGDVNTQIINITNITSSYSALSSFYYGAADTVSSYSAYWNEVSSFSANSGEFMLTAKLGYDDPADPHYITGYNNIPFSDKDTTYVGINGIEIDKTDPEHPTIGISADFLSANALDNLSGKWEDVYNTVNEASGRWDAHSALSATKLDASESAKFMKLEDLKGTEAGEISGYGESAFYYPPFPEIPEYTGDNGIEVTDEYVIKISADFLSASDKYLSANALDDLSGKWEDAADTVSSYSAAWNESSAFSAASGKFVTSAGVEFDENLAYFLKNTDGEVAWSGVDLSDLGKMYQISSLTPTLVSAGISADEEENPIYVISAVAPEQVAVPQISGDNLSAWKETIDDVDYYRISGADIAGHQGISARYDAETNQYDIGLSANNCYASYSIALTGVLNNYAPDTYTEQYNVGTGVTYDEELKKLTVDEGMWHVTIRAKITSTSVDTNYYDVTLTCNSNSTSVQFDNSYQHEEYLSLDYDLLNQDNNVQIRPIITNAPSRAIVTIERLQLHRVIAGYTVNAGGHSYYAGEGIDITDDFINAAVSSGLKIGNDNKIEVQPGSGIYIDQNNKLSVKLGKGLAFSADGDIISIETNSDVNEVVDIVENLKQELDGKLTTNMNISDAKAAGCPWDGDTTNINNIAASFFTIPLQHNLTTASEISFFATQGLGQIDADPLIVGILEYNFDYFEADAEAPNGVKTRSQTQWIADTGPIWHDTADINGHVLTAGAGRYTYKLKNVTVGSASDVTGTNGTVYHNEFGPALRSDRAYYLALYTYSPNSYKYFLCDEGYAGGINNTDPAISFRKTGTTYTDANGVERAITRDVLALIKSDNLPFSMSGMQYWDRHTNDANNMKRPYVMIRNPRL